MESLLTDFFIEAHLTPPKEIILDFDATDDPIHGDQLGRFFQGYYFDCFRFVFYLSLMEVGGYVVSSGTGGRVRFALVASRIRRPGVREYRIRTVFAGYARWPRGVVEP